MHWGYAISRGGYTARDIGMKTTTQTWVYEGQCKGWQGYEGRGMRGRVMFMGRGLIEIKIDIFCFLCFGQAEYTGFCGFTVGSMSFQLIDPQFFVTGVRTKK